MTFITQPDKTSWNFDNIANIAILIALADTAARNLTEVEPESQEAILKAIKDLPLAHLHIEAICACALAQDTYGLEHDEYNDDVIDAAWEIMIRDDVLPLVDVASIMKLIEKSDTPYRTMQAGVSLLAAMPAERIPFEAIIAVAEKHGEDDDAAFCAGVVDLLEAHDRYDDLRNLFDVDGDSDDDGKLAAACREAVEAHDASQEILMQTPLT